MNRIEKCASCGGKGWNPTIGQHARCTACHGAGNIFAKWSPEFTGKPWPGMENPNTVCPRCQMGPLQKNCETCRGRGVVPFPPEPVATLAEIRRWRIQIEGNPIFLRMRHQRNCAVGLAGALAALCFLLAYLLLQTMERAL